MKFQPVLDVPSKAAKVRYKIKFGLDIGVCLCVTFITDLIQLTLYQLKKYLNQFSTSCSPQK